MIIGIGVDIVDINSFTKAFKNSKRFRQRVFTESEIEYSESKTNNYQHYAARFAAKEAVMKAISTGWDEGVQWKQIEVKNEKNGKPTLTCTGKVLEILIEKNVCSCHLSLSQSETHAIAFVVLEIN